MGGNTLKQQLHLPFLKLHPVWQDAHHQRLNFPFHLPAVTGAVPAPHDEQHGLPKTMVKLEISTRAPLDTWDLSKNDAGERNKDISTYL